MTNIEKLENEIATIKSKILIVEAKLKNEAQSHNYIMRKVTIEIWSTKPCLHDAYTLYEKDTLLDEIKKTYNTDSSNRAMSFARRVVKTMRRNGELENQEATTITVE